MPLYSVKNYETGEEQDLNMTISQYEEWRTANPEWEKNWQAGVASAVSEVGDYQTKLPQGFKASFTKVKKHNPYAKFHKL